MGFWVDRPPEADSSRSILPPVLTVRPHRTSPRKTPQQPQVCPRGPEGDDPLHRLTSLTRWRPRCLRTFLSWGVDARAV